MNESVLSQISAQAFWDFALNVYKTDNVKDIALRWQDEKDVNVNIMLFCIWMDSLGGMLDDNMIDVLSLAAQEIQPDIRAKRTQRRAQGKGTSLYRNLLQEELMLEALQQKRIIERFKGLNSLASGPATPSHCVNLDRYLRQMNVDGNDSQAIELKEILKKNDYFKM